MTRKEEKLLAILRRDGQAETADPKAVRGLELRGHLERLGGGLVRYIPPTREVPPAERVEALKAALMQQPLSRKEAVDIVGDYRYLWLAMQDGTVVRLFSGDYAVIGGPVVRQMMKSMQTCILDAVPPGEIRTLRAIIDSVPIKKSFVLTILKDLCRRGKLIRVTKGEYTR